MKIVTTSFLCSSLVLFAALMSGCSTDHPVVITEPTLVAPTGKSTPLPISQIPVSTYPPQGPHQIIALINLEAGDKEPLPHFLSRLQRATAELGGQYVWLMGAQDDSSSENPDQNHSATAPRNTTRDISNAYAPRSLHSHTAMTAAVVEILAGSDKPDTSQPSMSLR
jgi:hypothetical protein